MSNEECAKLLIQLHSDYFELVCKYECSVEDKYAEAVAMAIMALAPTVDAVEVVHGWWLYSRTEAFAEECSQCGFCVPWDDGMLHEYNYCPNCGAKMDGDGNA